jgi:hypothetical protein
MVLAFIFAMGLLLGTQQTSQPSQAPEPQSGSTAIQQSPTSSDSKKAQPAVVHRKRRKKTPSSSKKVVVKNGSTPDPPVQFSTDSPQQAVHERQDIDGLLATTDSNLHKISPSQLKPNQQDMLTQIQSYMRQAKSAQHAGDLAGAHSLALKAQQLSAELLRK